MVLASFLPLINLETTISATNIQDYKFPTITDDIDQIISLPKPKDIDIINIQSNEMFFSHFIQEINRWLQWFNQFFDTFRSIIEWLRTYNIKEANKLLIDMDKIPDDPRASLLDSKNLVDRMVKILQPLKDLRRLCHLFNCLATFQIVDPGSLNNQDNPQRYISELKRFQSNNTFTVDARKIHEQTINIRERQQVQWSLASEKYDCSVTIEYRANGANSEHQVLYQKDNIPIYKNILNGAFETQQSGQLFITIDNQRSTNQKVISYRVKSMDLSICHLFDGIFKMHFNRFKLNSQDITEREFSILLDKVFVFIGQLLDGSLRLRDMADLRTIFSDRNINIREEVKKLATNRSREQMNQNQLNLHPTTAQRPMQPTDEGEIKQVCEWLQIYQYYSHINIIVECIEKFDILAIDTEDATIGDLRRLSGNENCSLKEITEAYKILQQRFQSLSHQHLQLIKSTVDYPNVVPLMKRFDLYSDHGRRRFQELRDNLTTQFQMQERNNMILNSWIMTYTLVEPFVSRANNFNDFILRLATLSNLDESVVNHIKGKILSIVIIFDNYFLLFS